METILEEDDIKKIKNFCMDRYNKMKIPCPKCKYNKTCYFFSSIEDNNEPAKNINVSKIKKFINNINKEWE